MTMYELVTPIDNNKELVIGVYATPDQATSAIHNHFVCGDKNEVCYVIRKQNNEEYM